MEIREAAEIVATGYDVIRNVVADGCSCSYSFIEDKELETVLQACDEVSYIIGFTNVKLKNKYRELFAKYSGKLVNVIHPTAFIAPSVKLGAGNFVAPLAAISSEAVLGDCNIVNLGVSIGHNCVLGDDNVLNPGARISGCVTIGDDCLFGSNAFVHQGISIASHCRIDALTYIKKDLDSPSICSNYEAPKVFKNIFVK